MRDAETTTCSMPDESCASAANGAAANNAAVEPPSMSFCNRLSIVLSPAGLCRSRRRYLITLASPIFQSAPMSECRGFDECPDSKTGQPVFGSVLRQAVGDIISRIVAARDGDDDVLLAIVIVGH